MARSRRPRGTGSYDKCGEYYRWRIGIYDPERGVTHYHSIKAKNRSALEKKVAAWKAEHGSDDAPSPIVGKKMLVKDWTKIWLEHYVSKRSPLTLEGYSVTVNTYINPRFGDKWLQNVSTLELQLFFDELAKERAPMTVITIRSHFHTCFERAKKIGLIVKNPVTGTEPPRYQRPELVVPDDEDIERILTVAKEGLYRGPPANDSETYIIRCNYIVVLLAVASGMRQGEILGLTWDCIHSDKIEVKYSLQNLARAHVLKSPKNGKPRMIAIPSAVADELAEWREYQEQYAAKYKGLFDNPQNLVCTNQNGRFINGTIFTCHVFHPMCEEAGITGVRFHDLRHYFASSALARGVSVMAVSEQLGHSNINITLGRYTHVLERSRDEMKKMLDSNPLFQRRESDIQGTNAVGQLAAKKE